MIELIRALIGTTCVFCLYLYMMGLPRCKKGWLRLMAGVLIYLLLKTL